MSRSRDEAGWTPEELAAVTGEPVERLAAFAADGLLNQRADGRYDADATERVRLIRFARERGVDESQLAVATKDQGDLLGLFVEGLGVSDLTEFTLREAATRSAVPPELMAELTGIVGWDPNEIATTDDVEALERLAEIAASGLDRAAVVQLIRVYHDLLDRLADAEIRIFHEYVHEKFRSDGVSGPDLLEATESLGKPLINLVEPTVLYFHRRAWQRVDAEHLLRHVLEDSTPPTPTPGEIVVTVLFIDLADFTPLTIAMGDAPAAEVLSRFAAMVRTGAGAHGGRIVKQIGDAFMLTFARADEAVAFGLDVGERIESESQFPAVHLGAHTGTVLFREGDYVGAGVNLAARVASAGATGQFLVTAEVLDAAGQLDDVEVTELPPRRLKGLTEPVRLIDIRPARPAERPHHRDPVCGMRLDPSDVVTVSEWKGRSYSFCSQECFRMFTEAPEKYVDAVEAP